MKISALYFVLGCIDCPSPIFTIKFNFIRDFSFYVIRHLLHVRELAEYSCKLSKGLEASIL